MPQSFAHKPVESLPPANYGRQWKKQRERFLKENPDCWNCLRHGKKTDADIVDHRIPHRGDKVLFWDQSNWQPLCKLCHDAHKQRLEKSGRVAGCTADGIPRDPNHHWNK